MKEARITICNTAGEIRGEVVVTKRPRYLLIKMLTQEEEMGLIELFRLMGMGTNGLSYPVQGKIRYVGVDDKLELFARALTRALKLAGLDVQLTDERGIEIGVSARPPLREAEFEYV